MERSKKISVISISLGGLLVEDPPAVVGIRHVLVGMLFLCMVFAYIIRVNISVAIVAMISSTSTQTSGAPTYDWDSTTKSLILSAFFWGNLLMNVPAAVIGHSVNNKWLLAITFAGASVLSLITPLMANWGGSIAVIIVRVLQGVCQGFMMPMIHGLLSKWAPPQERARFASFVLVGLNFGAMIVLAFSGVMADGPGGWPTIFYASGGLGLCWVIAWIILGANSPDNSRFISEAEKGYIKRALPNTAEDHVKMPIPWRYILTSGAVWATTLAHVGHNWGLWTILTEMPTYFTEAQGFSLAEQGYITALPFLILWIISFPLSYIADILIVKDVTSVTLSRKIWNSFAHYGGAIALFGIAFAGRHTTLVIVLYFIAGSLNGCIYMGFNVNHLDLSPNFARILMGITNGSANITAIIAPLFVGAVVKKETDIDEWRVVFLAAAIAFFIGNTAFITLGSGELQPWNEPFYGVYSSKRKTSMSDSRRKDKNALD